MSAPLTAPELTLACLATITGSAHGISADRMRGVEIDWPQLIAFASAHFVLQALPAPLKQLGLLNDATLDAGRFLEAVVEANASRNAILRDALMNMAESLNASGIVPVALKGATFLLDDAVAAPAPWRFMSDIDLLVTETELDTSVEVLRGLGFTQLSHLYDAASEAHFPPLISPCGTFSVELHTRLFGLDEFALPPDAVRREARVCAGARASIRVPVLEHRIAHVLSHAQLHNRNYAIRRLVLKDVLDLSQLAKLAPAGVDWSAILSRYGNQEQRLAAAGLVAAWQCGAGNAAGTPLDRAAEAWARQAICRLARPRWRELLELPADLFRMEAHRARRERGHWHRRLRLLSDPARLVRTSANWTAKQRQRLWS